MSVALKENKPLVYGPLIVEDFIPLRRTESVVFSEPVQMFGVESIADVYYGKTDLDETGKVYIVNMHGYEFHISGSTPVDEVIVHASDLQNKLTRTVINLRRFGGVGAVRDYLFDNPDKDFSLKENAPLVGLCKAGTLGFKRHLGAEHRDRITFLEAAQASWIDQRALLPAFVSLKP